MGLAASQARLLLLTARKSDLEYRAQCITNTEMILAMQTEAVARKYSQKISNQALFYTNADNANNKSVALSTGNFAMTVANAISAGYKLEAIIGYGADGKPQYGPWVSSNHQIAYKFTNTTDKDVSIAGQTVKPGEVVTVSENDYNANKETYGEGSFTQIVTQYDDEFDQIAFLEALNNGTLRIVNDQNEVVSLSANTGFTESYYTDDDAEAEAEYKRETAAIQVKEKRLQNDLQQVESQQKACETEIDSVKKVIEKNIEKTFKVFS